MKLIVGLGNPGKEYDNTRHNVGFALIDYIAKANNIDFVSEKFDAKYAEKVIEGEKVLFIKPLRYINLSGEVIRKYKEYYKLENSDILVIHDDMSMVLGKIRISYDSTSGGHNGIKNIETNLGNKEYTRLKIGISKNPNMTKIDYVLGKFSKEESLILNKTYSKLTNIVSDFIKLPINELKKVYAEKNEPEVLSKKGY